MKKLIGSVSFGLALWLFLPHPVLAVPHISLGVVGGAYVGDSSDPWLTDTTVTEAGTFTLQVLIGSSDLTDVNLIVAVPEGPGGTVSINGNPLTFGSSGQPPEDQPHGIYPTPYAYFELGDLDAGSINSYTVDWSGYSMVHFDAFGYSNNPHGNTLWDTPDSHDVTATPEPATLLLMGSGLLGLGALRKRMGRKAKED